MGLDLATGEKVSLESLSEVVDGHDADAGLHKTLFQEGSQGQLALFVRGAVGARVAIPVDLPLFVCQQGVAGGVMGG